MASGRLASPAPAPASAPAAAAPSLRTPLLMVRCAGGDESLSLADVAADAEEALNATLPTGHSASVQLGPANDTLTITFTAPCSSWLFGLSPCPSDPAELQQAALSVELQALAYGVTNTAVLARNSTALCQVVAAAPNPGAAACPAFSALQWRPAASAEASLTGCRVASAPGNVTHGQCVNATSQEAVGVTVSQHMLHMRSPACGLSVSAVLPTNSTASVDDIYGYYMFQLDPATGAATFTAGFADRLPDGSPALLVPSDPEIGALVMRDVALSALPDPLPGGPPPSPPPPGPLQRRRLQRAAGAAGGHARQRRQLQGVPLWMQNAIAEGFFRAVHGFGKDQAVGAVSGPVVGGWAKHANETYHCNCTLLSDNLCGFTKTPEFTFGCLAVGWAAFVVAAAISEGAAVGAAGHFALGLDAICKGASTACLVLPIFEASSCDYLLNNGLGCDRLHMIGAPPPPAPHGSPPGPPACGASCAGYIYPPGAEFCANACKSSPTDNRCPGAGSNSDFCCVAQFSSYFGYSCVCAKWKPDCSGGWDCVFYPPIIGSEGDQLACPAH
ncbi:hypothetical protein ABPG77_008014 [Micractinium sp. CCAP 211/92]